MVVLRPYCKTSRILSQQVIDVIVMEFLVTWGYLGDGAPPHAWGADAVIDHPRAVLDHL